MPQLRGVTAAAAFGMAGLGLLTVAFPLFAVEHLGVERSASGYMWAAFAVGSTLGALSLVRIQRRFPPERIVLTGYAVFGVLMLSWPLAGSLPVFLCLVALAALVDGPALAAQFAVRQQYVPPSLYGQVFTTAVGLKVGSFARRRGACRGGGHGPRLRGGAGGGGVAPDRRRRGRRHSDASPGPSGPRRSCSPDCGS